MLVEQNKTRVIIIEDHSILIEGLYHILQNVAGIIVSGTFTDGSSAIEFLRTNKVDVVFLDIGLPKISGIEVCKTIKNMDYSIKVIALSNYTEQSVIQDMLDNGANGYLLKNTSKKELISAVFKAMEGQILLNEEVAQILFSTPAKTDELPRLTKREKDVLKLVSEGITTAYIASKLFISSQTVESHRRNLMQKFKVNNAAAMIRKAIENHIID